MKCKDEIQYLVLVVNDYINNLPLSSRIAVGEKAQNCVQAIENALSETEEQANAVD